jgi:hypothetical protein
METATKALERGRSNLKDFERACAGLRGISNHISGEGTEPFSLLIETRLAFDGDPEVIWRRVSDVKSIPDYWHGTKSLAIGENVEGKKLIASARFAFGGSGKVEITTDDATRTLLLRYVSGPFTGTQTVRVGEKELEAKWDIEFHGIFRIASGRTAGHFKSGTVHALERLRDGVGQESPPEQKAQV